MKTTGRMKVMGALLGLIAALGMTACASEQSLPDLSAMGQVTAISREDGSGTKAEFETLLDTTEAGAKAVGTSTDEVSDMVAQDVNALGYLAYSSIQDTDQVKLISVDGVALTAENIRKEKYPLCRNYYLAYAGELSDLQQDFLSYVMSAGQQIVEQNCVPVKSASTFLSDKSSGTLRVCGSTSAAPLVEALAEDYKTYNPNVEIKMEASDSSQGLTSAIRGECDFAVSSRELKDYEGELLTRKAFARDGIAVIVNKENPVDNLSIKQIQKLYGGKCEKWSDLQ